MPFRVPEAANLGPAWGSAAAADRPLEISTLAEVAT